MTYNDEQLLEILWQFNLYFTGKSQLVEDGEIEFRLSEELSNERFNICKQCEFYDEKRAECTQCGCYLPVKTTDLGEYCPVDKWSADREGWLKSAEQLVAKIMEND